ncbi:NAD(+) diphosphatase [Altererythrobacter salegens]|uniref:NAD(+) diphosphatase n=1 Tax=Croceibacterium salegens TaxID=1737568 RepID=A0A6I4SU18_9SPHN|nr:NAD(+) diphosphatase [Croceibacterium salegens]MXO58376.1 NAD(+) diphosphatase [Croceibacterium salegens]
MRLAFTGHPLDRADHVRADPARLAALAVPEARVLKLDGLIPQFDSDRLTWTTLAEAGEDAELVFLGLLDGEACFGAVPEGGDPDPAYSRRETFAALSRLNLDDLALYGGARSLLDWHARHRFCAQCGQPTQPAKGGWQRDCPACKAQHFPRTDPVTIMLVEHDDRLLLGRNSRFPPGRYSALAGFIEPGETIEEAVAREVLEEAGVRVRDVSYVMNQPWPFPSQLMIACHSHADDDTLTIDETELADARWFTRAEVAEAMEKGEDSPTFIPPPPVAVAWHLLTWWLEKKA